MKYVTATDYYTDLKKFIEKHGKKHDWTVSTSPYRDGKYTKSYLFDDCSEFTEINEMENAFTSVDVDIHGIPGHVWIPVIRHEYYSTDDSESKYWIEVRSTSFKAEPL